MSQPQMEIPSLRQYSNLQPFSQRRNRVELRGDSLTIPALVAVSRCDAVASLDNLPRHVRTQIDDSVKFLMDSLANGHSVYGVTTGFGGSANTNTSSTNALQVALLQMQLCAVLPVSDSSTSSSYQGTTSDSAALAKLSMPEEWVRAAMVVRCNSVLRGHSAVRLEVIQAVVNLLEHNLVPLVPLRGSISASGDLCPLSYIAGVLESNPDVKVWSGPKNARTLIPANEAMRQAGMSSVQFGPKEILGLINGTAFSTGVATIAQHQADILAVLAQVLTAMGVEAMLGALDSFDPFIAAIRPHRGQIEVARNIHSFLEGSDFVRTSKHHGCGDGLRQDRYALRTSSQWLGPVLEDMCLAREQIEVELNSTTDNPLINVAEKHCHHGGNFQASSVASSTEKTRMGLEKIGKMLFAQSAELLNNQLAYNLPPNLAADEPSLSYTLKGVDINMAAYYSELAFLANPVSNHVQSAEMSNQALNSLALISARYTHSAVDIVSLMSSAYLYSLCQALDLRAMNAAFMDKLKPALTKVTTGLLRSQLGKDTIRKLDHNVWGAMNSELAKTTSMDSHDRFVAVARAAQPLIIDALEAANHEHASDPNRISSLSLVTEWTSSVALTTETIFCANREEYLANPDASKHLGKAARIMYVYVRGEMGIPMHRGLVDHPTYKGEGMADGGREKVTTGTQISRIYKALRDGDGMAKAVMRCLEESATEKEVEVGGFDGGMVSAKL
ncbi:related to phenylalanine ammonia-lyase [Phialocephala subalpina]|uniref:Related to phenylalanine ammonia-lyase n=1 Tax=Phialocephala subalpina TaxID=576137 RepID=A0A1L7XNX6_9HELO|nr:related to phenylalanine ammonia-lyase [Phialocephala subalpina]